MKEQQCLTSTKTWETDKKSPWQNREYKGEEDEADGKRKYSGNSFKRMGKIHYLAVGQKKNRRLPANHVADSVSFRVKQIACSRPIYKYYDANIKICMCVCRSTIWEFFMGRGKYVEFVIWFDIFGE